ncbi:MAG: RnfABCDGE type electron transport complex subunit C [Pseudomonadota bacterium]
MKSGTFPGGLSLPVSGAGASKPFESIPPSQTVIIPLKQHVGEPCAAGVKKDAEVKMGDLLGESESTAVHATVSGKVAEVIKKFPDMNGGYVPAIGIESDGKNESRGLLEGSDPMSLIQKGGVVDCDVVAISLHDKLTLAKEKSVKTLIVNGVDVEPHMISRASILAENAKEVASGIDIISKILGGATVHIGVSENASNAISAICGACSSANVVALKAKHPQSMQELLVKAILGKEVPTGGVPEEIGVTVISAETAYFTAQAVNDKKPMLERFITVTGSGIGSPKNVLVRIGTPIKDVLEHCGAAPGHGGKVIIGGPLMGTAIHSADMPVTKETTGIYVQKEREIADFPSGVCIKCGLCVEVCPMRLMPLLISGFSESGNYSLAEKNDIMSCIECGCCAYVCPVLIPMVQWIKLGKSEIRAQKE